MKRRMSAIGICLFFLAAIPASASIITFTDRTTWLGNMQGVTNIDFEGIAPSGSWVSYWSSTNIGGITFTNPGSDKWLWVIDPGFSPFYNWGSGAVLHFERNSPPAMIAGLPGGTYGVGFDLMTFWPYEGVVGLSVTAGVTYQFEVATANYDVRTFFGMVSTDPISSITFTSLTYDVNRWASVNIDNFAYGQSAIPEPTSLFLLGAGLAGLAIAAWRRKK